MSWNQDYKFGAVAMAEYEEKEVKRLEAREDRMFDTEMSIRKDAVTAELKKAEAFQSIAKAIDRLADVLSRN